MCLIVAKSREGNLPPEEHLREGYFGNSDGIGVCFWKKDTKKVCIKKDFLGIEHLLIWMKQHIDKEDGLIIHFRKATSGLIDEGNRHPFPITRDKELIRKVNLDCKIAVAHNGIFTGFSDHKSDFSDSQHFVMEILAESIVRNNIHNKVMQKLLCEFIGSFNKLAFLDKDGIVTLLGRFEEENVGGTPIYYSNSGYKTFRSYYGRNFYGKRNEESLEEYYERIYGDDYIYQSRRSLLTNKEKDNKKEEQKEREEQDFVSVHSKDGEMFLGYCECCEGFKNLRKMEGEDRTYILCRKCRYKARKGKLILKQAECSSCGMDYFVSQLNTKFNNKDLLCHACMSIDYI